MINSSTIKKTFLSVLSGVFLLLHLFFFKASAQQTTQRFYKADQQILFKWRYGYSEFPFPDNVIAQEDALRGKFGWYDGALWSQAYKCWDSTTLHGVQLLFRGGSPYAREVICTSETVPYEAAGTPVSFLLPFMYTIGSEDEIAFSLRVKGNEEETIVCKLHPEAITSFTGGMFKASFITLKVSNPSTSKPLVTVTGMMHIRVYPQLVSYGSRTSFIFSSVTHHMDVESSLVLGSLYKDMTIDPYELAEKIKLSTDTISSAWQQHNILLSKWRQSTAQLSARLQQKGRVEVLCNATTQKRNRGELRVTAYSGNPVKDFQYGPPSPQIKAMAQAVTTALGKRFSLFRYQHHYLPWKMDNPAELDSAQIPYLQQWLHVAGASADSVLLDLQLSPIVKLYKQHSQMGHLQLPPAGIPGAEWDKIKQGYLTAIQFAKKNCPSLKIIQMPYELDNISNTDVHADAHYRFFKCLYEAVAIFNKQLPANDQLKIAGLGGNNPNNRWDFINGFLNRYSRDTSTTKQLDYITWHNYLFPGNFPAQVKGVSDSLQLLFRANHFDKNIRVIVDEMGLAEPSTIEDLSELQGAMKKEAAMASFSSVIQDYYEKEGELFIPISGAGWHFALLTYGKQNILSTYAKGLLLRSKLGDSKIPVNATPVDSQGYGLHAVATKEKNKISVLVFCASPSIFYEQATPLNYSDIELMLRDLPDNFKNTKLKVTQWYYSPEDESVRKILSQEKFQTLPLTRGADRYEKNFSPEEVKSLNEIKSQSSIIVSNRNDLNLSTSIDAYGMRLIQIEPVSAK